VSWTPVYFIVGAQTQFACPNPMPTPPETKWLMGTMRWEKERAESVGRKEVEAMAKHKQAIFFDLLQVETIRLKLSVFFEPLYGLLQPLIEQLLEQVSMTPVRQHSRDALQGLLDQLLTPFRHRPPSAQSSRPRQSG
jgi:hypothetical protein